MTDVEDSTTTASDAIAADIIAPQPAPTQEVIRTPPEQPVFRLKDLGVNLAAIAGTGR